MPAVHDIQVEVQEDLGTDEIETQRLEWSTELENLSRAKKLRGQQVQTHSSASERPLLQMC